MATTLIGGSTRIEGEISEETDLRICGAVKGRITVRGNVYVETTGTVEAEIDADSLEVAGRLTGDMKAVHKVEIVAGGQAVGDVRAQRILIADGAVFKGNVDMSAPIPAGRG